MNAPIATINIPSPINPQVPSKGVVVDVPESIVIVGLNVQPAEPLAKTSQFAIEQAFAQPDGSPAPLPTQRWCGET
jgi:hypothetical protein